MLVSAKNLRSRGCRTCIVRKVKCDQTRPNCQRCTRRGDGVCGGYRDQHDLVFRPCNLQQAIEPLWEDLAVPYFISNFTTTEPDGRPGHLDFLPDLYRTKRPGHECFLDTLFAVSAAAFGQHRHDENLSMEALKAYGKALVSLRDSLADDEFVQQDIAVAAILLMSRFETIMGQESSSKAGVHFCAAFEVIKARKPDRIGPLTGRLFYTMRLELAVRNLGFLQELHDINGAMTFPCDIWSFSNVLLQTERVALDLWNALQSRKFPSSHGQDSTLIEAKALEALRLMQHLRVVENKLKAEWGYTTVPHSSENSPMLSPTKGAYTFTSIQLAAQWTAVWCAQARLEDTLTKFLNLDSIERNNHVRSTVAHFLLLNRESPSHVEKICASAPYLIGELDDGGQKSAGLGPMLLAPVLFIAGSSWSITKAQKAWICDKLIDIGQRKGIGQALVFEQQLREGVASFAT